MNIKEFMVAVKEDAVDWCKGRNWIWRLPFLIWFSYVLIRHLGDPMYNSILGGLNLGIHEFGHLVTGPLGTFICVSGGTIFQILIPLLSVYNFLRQRDYFSASLCFGWLSTNY